jgi:hypothetical protein
MTTAHDPLSARFADCRTPTDADDAYKALFDELGITDPNSGNPDYMMLSEMHRQTLERISSDNPMVTPKEDDGRVRGRTLRNWAARQGIPLRAKGRVPVEVENLYRAEQGLDLLPVQSPPASLSDAGVDSATIRIWAKGQDIPCGSRGRVHTDVIRAYIDANGSANGPDEQGVQPTD